MTKKIFLAIGILLLLVTGVRAGNDGLSGLSGLSGLINAFMTWNYDNSQISFTAGMANRTAAGKGPFTTAPLIQGDWAATTGTDVLSFPLGNQVSGEFYDNYDGNQGSIVFWITPEWDGDDGKGHRILDDTAHDSPQLYKDGTDLRWYDGTNSVPYDISGWTAGSTYSVIVRWDSRNVLDGTNHVCISVDDSHTFGGTSSYAPDTPTSPIAIGSYATGVTHPANAVIEGLTIYRRVLFDGTNGVDVNNGVDEINLISDASDRDPTLVTGSWDVVFALPTDSSEGALATTGQAWSHPHSSNVITPTDGFMATAFASSDWGDTGTPITPESVEFNAGDTSVNSGSDAGIDNLHDDLFVAEAWIRPDGYGEGGGGRILDKTGNSSGGWMFYMSASQGLKGYVYTDGGQKGEAGVGTDDFTADGLWHHVVMAFDDAGDRKTYLAIDGVWAADYDIQTAGVDTRTSDASYDLYVGNRADGTRTFDGAIGWTRVYTSAVYTVGNNFTPTPRTNPPATAVGTALLYHMDEGSGTTLDNEEGTAARDGTISNGSWNTVRDMATDSPGARIYPWGYVFGSDAANEGINVAWTGLDAGEEYVLRALGYSEDGTGQPKVLVYDSTNSANLTLLEGTTSSTELAPDNLLLSFELPTAARNGVGSDCTAIQVQLLNKAGTGVVGWHQVELLVNLLDAPSFEVPVSAIDPWIPTGWTNVDLDAGETISETGTMHSGTYAVKWTTGADSEGFKQSYTATDGDFYSLGFWAYGDTSKSINFDDDSGTLVLKYQADAQGLELTGNTGAAYDVTYAVVRAAGTAAEPFMCAEAGASGERFIDDVYMFALDDVTLTVTGANAANSIEGDGTRVDGLDDGNVPISSDNSTTTEGWLTWDYTPRHSAANAVAFAESGGSAYIAELYGDADDYIRIYWSSANTVTLAGSWAGNTDSVNWDATGSIAAGTTYVLEVKWSTSNIELFVDSGSVAEISGSVTFGTAPGTFYCACAAQPTGGSIGDAVCSDP